MAEFETSKEERLQIAQHFLLSSPPGEFSEVLTDVRKLMTDGILTESLETGIARVYNTKNGKIVTAPSGSKVVIATAGEVDSTHYVDATNGSVFAVDHLTLVSVASLKIACSFDFDLISIFPPQRQHLKIPSPQIKTGLWNYFEHLCKIAFHNMWLANTTQRLPQGAYTLRTAS